MTISFDTIPTNLLVPGNYTETSTRRASSSTPVRPTRITVIDQRLTAGTSAAGVPFQVFAPSDADSNAGVGSKLANMLKVIKAANKFVELWGIGLDDDGAGIAASATFTFTGTVTADGSFVGYVGAYWEGSTLRGRYAVAVASGDAVATIATNWAAVVNADPYRVVDAVAALGVVTLTARQKGAWGNELVGKHSFFSGESLPTGLACAITAFSTGATNPDISTGIAALGDAHTSHLVIGVNDATSLTAVDTEMVRRWGGTVQLECHAFAGAGGSLSTLTTLGDTRNNQFMSLIGSGLSMTPPWIAAAGLAAIDAGMDHPGRPLKGLAIDCMVAPAAGSEFTSDERQQLLAEGVSTFTVDSSGKCQMDRLVTTYQEDAFGNADATWRNRQTAGLLYAIRYDWRTAVAAAFPRYMHAADGSDYDPGLPVVTPSSMKSFAANRARQVWMTGQAWIEDADQFEEDLIIDRTDDGMDFVFAPNLINGLRITKARLDFLR